MRPRASHQVLIIPRIAVDAVYACFESIHEAAHGIFLVRNDIAAEREE